MRVKLAGELGKTWPATVQLLTEHFNENALKLGLQRLHFQVDGMPLSLNHQYHERLAFCKPGTPGAFQDRSGRWRVRSKELRSEAHDWRLVLTQAMGPLRFKWQPTGTTAAILLFETPHWLTGKRQVRQMDADNKTKPALDAIQEATEIPDELHWQFHVFKVLSKRQRTTIFLYDLGDIVEYWY